MATYENHSSNSWKEGWETELVDTVRACFLEMPGLRRCGVSKTPRGKHNAECLVDLGLWVLTKRFEDSFQRIYSWPQRTLLCLDPAEEGRKRAMDECREWFATACNMEAVANKSAIAKQMYEEVFWWTWPCNRLLGLLFEKDTDPNSARLKVALESIHRRFYDEKVAEDCHQHGTDEKRRRRSKQISRTQLFHGLVKADVLGKRGMKRLRISPRELARQPNSILNRPVKHLFKVSPKTWPKALDKILHKDRKYPSPTIQGYIRAAFTWHWIRTWMNSQAPGQSQLRLSAAWRSKLLPLHGLIRKGNVSYMVLVVQAHAYVTLKMVDHNDGRHVLFKARRGLFAVEHLTDEATVNFLPSRPAYLPRFGACLEITGDPVPILPEALRRGVGLTHEQTAELMQTAGIEEPDGPPAEDKPLKSMLTDLCAHTFQVDPADETVKHAVDACLKADMIDEPVGCDGDLLTALETVTEHDSANASELKELKAILRKSMVKEIVTGRRATMQLKRAKAKAKAAAKRRAGAKAKAKAQAEGHRLEGGGELAREPPPEPAREPAREPAGEPAEVPAAAPPPPPQHEEDPEPPRDPNQDAVPPPRGPNINFFGRQYTTPEIIRSLLPPLPGFALRIDVPGCRWQGTANGERIPSFGFGPTQTTRSRALEAALNHMWDCAPLSTVRQRHQFVAYVPYHMWGGLLDVVDERPRKYIRRAD